MKRLPFYALALGIPCLMCGPAAADDTPAVAAKLAPLTKGSLPKLITIYGQVGPDTASRHSLIAPVEATVTNVFVRTGEPVTKGEKLVELTPSPTSQTAYEQAKTALNLAVNVVDRTRSLVAGHLATQQDLAQAEKNEADARATFDALSSQGAAGAHDITAPFDGIITQLQANPGDVVAQGAVVAQIVQPSGLMLVAGVVPSDAMSVKPGDPVTLTPIDGGSSVQGSVSFRGSFVDTANGLVPVDVSIPQGDSLLGEMFRADIDVGNVNGYLVPHHAVLVDDSGEPYVMVSNKMVAKQVSVKVLESNGNKDVIAGPLDPSMPLVVDGAYQMTDGTPITLESSQDASAASSGGN
ncbi:MAG: efflux RND transporter periplasmic adaptor subunit [Rhodospirillales bacterium]|nr:efflux RND transporter periplasmic adaptor subunit [Rhodospirillales bacterium]